MVLGSNYRRVTLKYIGQAAGSRATSARSIVEFRARESVKVSVETHR
jgi:hypothetical protein